MTASERLAALVGPVTGDDINRLLAALPEIVAVVKAAEVIGIPGRGTELRDALAALDAKLAGSMNRGWQSATPTTPSTDSSSRGRSR